MNHKDLFIQLDDVSKEVFWNDITVFSPIFLTSKDEIQKRLANLETRQSVFDADIFIEYWLSSVIEWYRRWVYSTAVKILNNKYWKINSFKKWEETGREKQVREYEDAFEKLLLNKKIWIRP